MPLWERDMLVRNLMRHEFGVEEEKKPELPDDMPEEEKQHFR